MRSSERQSIRALWALAWLGATALSGRAQAQVAQGFAVERLAPSPAGAGWFVMDELELHGGFGGALAITAGYAHDPLDPANAAGTQRLNVIADQAFADIAASVTYDRFRLSLDLTSPLAITGNSGTLDGVRFTAPAVSLGNNPDTLSDPRVGLTARILGAPGGPFRLGGSAQLYLPSGSRVDYDTDGTFRAMFQLLAAGDLGWFKYAGQIGLHLRPLDDSPLPGSAAGNELLFGVAAGARLWASTGWAVVVGPEVFGETALRAFFGGETTGVEALLGGRLEGTGDGVQPRFKVSVGAGLDPRFGAPEWRLVFSAEMFSRH